MEGDLKGLFITIECNNCGLGANQQVQLNLTVKSQLYALSEEFIMRGDCDTEMRLDMLLLLDLQVADHIDCQQLIID